MERSPSAASLPAAYFSQAAQMCTVAHLTVPAQMAAQVRVLDLGLSTFSVQSLHRQSFSHQASCVPVIIRSSRSSDVPVALALARHLDTKVQLAAAFSSAGLPCDFFDMPRMSCSPCCRGL